MRTRSHSGFTVLEIMIAAAIFAFSVVVLIQSRSQSLKSVAESEDLFRATELAQAKVIEMELEYQTRVSKEGVKEGLSDTQAGVFPAPFDLYRWEAKLTESTVKLSIDEIKSLMQGFGIEEDEIEAQLEQQKILLANINKMIKENYAELTVTVLWERFGRTYRLPIVTHLIPAEPKIQLTTNTDEAEGS